MKTSVKASRPGARKQPRLSELGLRKIGDTAMGVTEYRLANGLKILLAPSHAAPVVTYMQLFRVGSRDEGVGHTGATHFLEHMMFKGTRKFDPAKGLDSTELFNRIGAVSNATTWFDRTNYFEAVPSQYLEFCIKVEADRMRNLRLRQEDRDSEMSVVRNEMERGENSPDEVMEKEMYAMAFREHPYHHTTIGWRTDVENVPMSRLKAFYDQFYWPNNCTIIVVGDFDTTAALKLISRYYGRIPRSPAAIPQMYTVEPPQEGERRYTVERTGDLPRVWVGYHTPSSSHPDHYPLNVASHVLGGSGDRSSRLYRLQEEGLVMEINTRHDELRDPAMFLIAATLTPGVPAEEVEKQIFVEIEKLAEHGATDEELAPIRLANRKGSVLARADQMEFAFALGEAEARADWRWLVDFDDRFESVTSKDIMEAVSTYFVRENRTVGRFVPSEAELAENPQAEEVQEEEEIETAGRPAKKVPKLKPQELAQVLCSADESSRASLSSSVEKMSLENGLVLQYLHNPHSGSVSVFGSLRCGNAYEPSDRTGLADVTAEMLTRGSEGMSKLELAQLLKGMGVLDGLSVSCDAYSIQFGSTVVAEDLADYLKAAALMLRRPQFATSELDKLKLEWQSKIIEQRNNPGPVAVNRLLRAIYPSGHIFEQPEFDTQLAELQAMTCEDARAFHSKRYSPSSMVLTIVGDVEKDRVMEIVARFFGDWTGVPAPVVQVPPVSLPERGSRIEARLKDKASMHIFLGHVCSVKRTDPDFYALYLANLALGGDTIISRLGKVVREQYGLTYGIHSDLGDTTGGYAPWTVNFSVHPDNAAKALHLVSEILADYKTKGITRDELAREATGAAGLFTVSMRSTQAIARVLNRFEVLGLGAAGADMHASKILGVKKPEVDAAIEKYLHPDRMVTVLAGTF